MRSYRVNRSKYYKKEKADLFISYEFEYFNEKQGLWFRARNINTKQKLKDIIIDKPHKIGSIIMM